MSRAPSGFVISSIEMEGFMRYKDKTKISLPKQFTAITGPTGSGKSTILDAITFALYGSSSRTDERLKIEEFVDENGYVRLVFYQMGLRYEVVRGRKSGRNYVGFSQSLQAIGGTTSEIQREIINTVGLDYVGFRNSTFIRQDEMKAIGSETGAQRLDVFQRLFRLEVFERAQKIADERLRQARETSIATSAKMGQKIDSYEQTLPSKRKELNKSETLAKESEKKTQELRTKASEAKKHISKLQSSHEEYSKASEDVVSLADSVKENEKKLEEARRKDKQRAELSQELVRLKKLADEYLQLSPEMNKLTLQEQKASGLEDKLGIRGENISKLEKTLHGQTARIRKRLDEHRKRLKSVHTDLSKSEAFELLRLEGALKERIERIDKETGWLSDRQKILDEIMEERQHAQEQLPKVSKKTASINEDIFLKTEIENSIREIDEELSSLRTQTGARISEEQEIIEKLERELRGVGFTPKMKVKLTNLQSRMEAIKSDTTEYTKKQERLEDLPDQRALIRELTTSTKALKNDLIRTKKERQDLLKPEQEFNRLSKELEKMQVAVTQAIEDEAGANGRASSLRREVKDLENLGPDITKLKRALSELQTTQEIYTLLKEEIFHRKGIPIYAINQLLQGISREASFLLGDLTDKRLNNIRLTPYSDTKGGGVRIEVEGVDGLFHDVSVFSGGEKTQVNAALRFSIAKELASMPQVGKSYGNMKTLFIDEGDLGSLDTEQSRKLFVRKLFALGNLFEKVILITHITEVADEFPSRIRVSMTPEQFSTITSVRGVSINE